MATTSAVHLFIVASVFCFIIGGARRTFEETLQKHGLQETTIDILKTNGIISADVLRALHEEDLKDLGLNIGQKALLRKVIQKLRIAAGEEADTSNNQRANQERQDRQTGSDERRTESEEQNSRQFSSSEEEEVKVDDTDKKLDQMTQEQFTCVFKCLGGIGAVSLGGILALVALVKFGLPLIGFGAIGITVGSLAAKIMSLYGGTVGAGSVMATLQSVAAVGVSWKAMLLAMFGSGTVYTAIQGACSHCFIK